MFCLLIAFTQRGTFDKHSENRGPKMYALVSPQYIANNDVLNSHMSSAHYTRQQLSFSQAIILWWRKSIKRLMPTGSKPAEVPQGYLQEFDLILPPVALPTRRSGCAC